MWLAKVCNMQFAARAQHSTNLFERTALIVASQMMQHQTGQHAVKRLIGIGQHKSQAALPLDLASCSFCFCSCPIEYLNVPIDPGDFCCRMKSLDHDGQRASAAAQVEHALARLNVRLFNQAALEGPLVHEPLQKRVI